MGPHTHRVHPSTTHSIPTHSFDHHNPSTALPQRNFDAPGWVAVLLCLLMAAFALAVMLFAVFMDERHPPFYGFGLAIAWALLAIASGARDTS